MNSVVLAALAAWRRQQWQSRSNSVTLGVIWASVALEIAAGDEVDKKGSFEDQLLYIKNIWRCARETRKTFIGVLIHAI